MSEENYLRIILKIGRVTFDKDLLVLIYLSPYLTLSEYMNFNPRLRQGSYTLTYSFV